MDINCFNRKAYSRHIFFHQTYFCGTSCKQLPQVHDKSYRAADIPSYDVEKNVTKRNILH
jgi:hypothetical protein